MLSVRSNPSPSGHCGRVLGRGLDCAELHNADEGLRNDDEDGIRIGVAMEFGAVHAKKTRPPWPENSEHLRQYCKTPGRDALLPGYEWIRYNYGGDVGMFTSEVRMRTMERSCGSCCHQAEHRSGGAVLQRQSLPPKLHVPHQATEI